MVKKKRGKPKEMWDNALSKILKKNGITRLDRNSGNPVKENPAIAGMM